LATKHYSLTEVLTDDGKIAFTIIVFEDKGTSAFAVPFEVRHCFDWLEQTLRSQNSYRVTIKGFLGQDVDKTFEMVNATGVTPERAVRNIWKAWQTQAAQAKAAVVRQRVIWNHK
jgi:hypothetical protein